MLTYGLPVVFFGLLYIIHKYDYLCTDLKKHGRKAKSIKISAEGLSSPKLTKLYSYISVE